jgi:anti-anti-sigma factor
MTTTAAIGRPVRVEVSGDLDLPVGDDLEAVVAPRLGRGARVEIDVRGVSFADSSGVGALVALAQLAAAQGADLVLIGPSRHLARVLDVTGVQDLFHIVPAGTD